MDKKQFQKIVSVIVPVYNGEAYLKRCLNSICKQSFRDLEIIVVDDGSKDGTAQIVKKLSAEDPRIKLCQHQQNMGLFQARITGVEASHGEYIGFVDADDEISIDWFRLLYQTATEQKNDITIGQFFEKFSDGRLEYLNLDPLRQEVKWEGNEVFQNYIGQEGTCCSWQTIWNKLYSRELWMRVLAETKAFSKEYPQFVLCEDMVFSTALWLNAQRVGNFTHGAFYCHTREGRKKFSSQKSRRVMCQRIHEAVVAFDFIEAQMKKNGIYEQYEQNLENWKKYYAYKCYEKLTKNKKEKSANDEALVCEGFGFSDPDAWQETKETHDYFYSVKSEVNQKLFSEMEKLKADICSAETRVVSFDIFDTLILRPFFVPSDLYYLMNEDYNRLNQTNSYFNFSDIRINAEARCRARIAEINVGFEDITLDEIYEQLGMDYGINAAVLQELKQKEQELEIHFCTARKMGKQLFELAKSQGKRVILCSDMYLPQQTVERILEKNGYDYDKLYLSSTLRVGKWTRNLFKYVQKDLNIPANYFLHIGDNYESDVVHSKDVGWNSAQLMKPLDLFKQYHPTAYSGELYSRIVGYNGLIRDGMNAEWTFLGYRCAMAMVANRFYDDPFHTTAADTDFDADPYKIGYFAVGHYLYAVTDWIIKKAKRDECETIHFVARDGYLPMEAYQIFSKFDSTLPKDNYLYVSRKALALADIYHGLDMFSFWNKFAIFNYSPYKMDKMLNRYYKDGVGSLQDVMDVGDAVYKKHFDNRAQFEKTINLLNQCVDFEKLNRQKDELRNYFSAIIGKNDLLFDIGYSGRCEAALSRLLGYPVNSLYIHSNSQAVNDREKMYHFHTDCFYDYKPCITGVMREHVFMKQAPSAVGYEKVNGMLEPKFEKYKVNSTAVIFTSILQNAALDFVRDMCTVFAGYTDMLAYRKDDLAYAFEYYLHYAKPIDRKVFGCVIFEDEVGLGKAVSTLNLWNQDLAKYHFDRPFSDESLKMPIQVEHLCNTYAPYSFRSTCQQIIKTIKTWMRAKFFLRPYVTLLESSPYFDAEWYLKTYPDVGVSGLSPARHYLLYGWRELRDPSADFSTRRYLELNPDVLAQGVCPLLHYEQSGKKEQRKFS